MDIQYERNDFDLVRGTFRVRGDVLEILPSNAEKTAIRVEFFGDEIERLSEVSAVTGAVTLLEPCGGLPRQPLRHQSGKNGTGAETD